MAEYRRRRRTTTAPGAGVAVLHRALEEACATVVQARLLGYLRSACVAGPQVGLVLVRSVWRAEVELAPWAPRFEIPHRRVVAGAEVWNHLALEGYPARIINRLLQEAAIV